MADWTTDDYKALTSAIKQGVKTVKYADKTVEYMSLDELLKLRDVMATDLGLSKPHGGRFYASTSKGLYPKCR